MADWKEPDNADEKSKLNADGDTAKIKFQQSTNGEAKIEMPEAGSVGFQCGLTKEELMKYANDPFWVMLRRVLLVLFWLLWIAMLAGAVAIIVVLPGCTAPKEPEWYESSPVYEIRVDRFFDGSGDKKPDLKGIAEKLPYLEEISVSTVVLDRLYDPRDQRIIDPSIGSFNDFKNITDKVKVLLKIPLSKVPLDSDEQQRSFATTLDFWLKKGAAGFVFDEIELMANKVNFSKLVGDWTAIIVNSSTEEFPRATVLSSYGEKLDEADYCSNGTLILDYGLTKLQRGFTAAEFVERFERTTTRNASACRANLVLSNGDIAPLTSRFEPHERDRIIMFSLLADATPFVFYGEEYPDSESKLPLTLQRGKAEPTVMPWDGVLTMAKRRKNSFFMVFAKTSKIRNTNYAIQMGTTHLATLNDTVVAMSRIKKGVPGYVVVTNFGEKPVTVDLADLGSHMPDRGDMEIASSGADLVKGKQNFRELTIGMKETKVFHFVPKFEKS